MDSPEIAKDAVVADLKQKLAKSLKDVDRLKLENDDYHKKIEKLAKSSKDVDRLKLENDDYHKKVEKLAKSLKNFDRLQLENDDYHKKIEKLEWQDNEDYEAIAKLEKVIDAKTERIQACEEEVKTSKTRYASLEYETKMMQNTHKKEKKKLEDIVKKQQAAVDADEQKKTVIAQLEEDMQHSHEHTKMLWARCEVLEQEGDALREQLLTLRFDNKNYQSEIKRIEEESKALAEDRDQLLDMRQIIDNFFDIGIESNPTGLSELIKDRLRAAAQVSGPSRRAKKARVTSLHDQLSGIPSDDDEIDHDASDGEGNDETGAMAAASTTSRHQNTAGQHPAERAGDQPSDTSATGAEPTMTESEPRQASQDGSTAGSVLEQAPPGGDLPLLVEGLVQEHQSDLKTQLANGDQQQGSSRCDPARGSESGDKAVSSPSTTSSLEGETTRARWSQSIVSPWWFWLLCFFLVLRLVDMYTGAMAERNRWLAANDLSRQYLLSYRGSSGLASALESYLFKEGVGRGRLG